MISENSALWHYLPPGQRSLIKLGFYLLDDLNVHLPAEQITDYSFVVFPFAKAYEGFLKQLFLDMGLIEKWQYEHDNFRIGKVLSPFLQKMLRGRSVYRQLTQLTGNSAFADRLWMAWKRGRNLLFHYYPHNLSSINRAEAQSIIDELIKVMEEAVEVYQSHASGSRRRLDAMLH